MSIIRQTAERMIRYEQGNSRKIEHLLKVTMYARLIALGEIEDPADRELVELAALTHDIGIRPALEKYGSAAGSLQEQEGPPVAETMLRDLGIGEDRIRRICTLIGMHHTLDPVGGLDHQIIIEADYLVNAAEQGASQDEIAAFRDQHFRTETGVSLLNAVFFHDADQSM